MSSDDHRVSPFSIRPARPDDFDSFFAAFEAVAAEGKWLGAQLPLDADQLRVGFVERIEDDDVAALLAVSEHDGELVGWINAELSRTNHVNIGMGVVGSWRGRGVGRALVEASIEWARAKGAHKMTLQAWPHNEAAIALYQKTGFQIEGRLVRHWRRKNGELWDAIVMGLVLDETSPGSPH